MRTADRAVPFTDVAQRFGRRRSAMHAADAVLVLCGQGIRRGVTVDGARVIDVAPALLTAAGLPLPPDMDGRALDVFEK